MNVVEKLKKIEDHFNNLTVEEFEKNLEDIGLKPCENTLTISKVKNILIDGVIETDKNPITVQEFTDEFIKWIESKGWYFGGVTREYIEDEE